MGNPGSSPCALPVSTDSGPGQQVRQTQGHTDTPALNCTSAEGTLLGKHNILSPPFSLVISPKKASEIESSHPSEYQNQQISTKTQILNSFMVMSTDNLGETVHKGLE